MDFKEKVDNYKYAMKDMTASIQHQYDIIFYNIDKNIRNTVDRLETDGVSERLLIVSAGDSVYVDEHRVMPDIKGMLELLTGAETFNFDEDWIDLYSTKLLKVKMDHKYYVTHFVDDKDQGYFLLTSIDFDYISDIINHTSFEMFDTYSYLITDDGYCFYHPSSELDGYNIFSDKKRILHAMETNDEDYEAFIEVFNSPSQLFYYHVRGIGKVGYGKALNNFEGTVFLSANYGDMIMKVHMDRIIIMAPLTFCFIISMYILFKYIYTLRYTDYCTELRNGHAFEKDFIKKRDFHKLLVLSIDEIVTLRNDLVINDDQVYKTITMYFKEFGHLYKTLYRLTRTHFVFNLHDDSDVKEVVQRLNENISSSTNEMYSIKGKVIGLKIETTESIDDYELCILQTVKEKYVDLHQNTEVMIYSYAELRKEYNESVLKKAYVEKLIAEREVNPFYQPIVDIHQMDILKYEVLMRPIEEAKMDTGEIVKIAEHAGWITDLDKTIIQQSFEFYHEIHMKTGKEIKLSINLSGASVSNDMVVYLESIARRYHVKPKDITIEITETAAFRNIDDSVKILEKLRVMGYSLAIDDFGTGYAHIELLSKLTVDYVKLDGVFVTHADKDQQKLKTLNALVDLAKNYNAKVIAEFVETESIIPVLASLNVEYGQGYYYSEPLCSGDVMKSFNLF